MQIVIFQSGIQQSEAISLTIDNSEVVSNSADYGLIRKSDSTVILTLQIIFLCTVELSFAHILQEAVHDLELMYSAQAFALYGDITVTCVLVVNFP